MYTLEVCIDMKTNFLIEFNDLLSADDLSRIFNVSIQTIYKELRENKFGDPIKVGRTYKIPKRYIIEKFF